MTITFQQQFEMTAIINRLVKPDGLPFDQRDALRLRDFVFFDCGLKPGSKFSAEWFRSTPSSQVEAYAANVGNVSIKKDEKSILEVGGSKKFFCGSWSLSADTVMICDTFFNLRGKKIRSVRQKVPAVSINRRFDETRQPQDEESYALAFSQVGNPISLSKMEFNVVSLRLFGAQYVLSLERPNKKPFKLPAPPQ